MSTKHQTLAKVRLIHWPCLVRCCNRCKNPGKWSN